MKEFAIILLLVVLVLVVFFQLRKNASSHDDSYRGKAKLIARFTDDQGCFLCQFKKNGKIINAIYGNDGPDLKVGDEVDIVWGGWYKRLPHVMDKEVYDLSIQMMDRPEDTL